MHSVIELGSLRSVRDWANLDLSRLPVRARAAVLGLAASVVALCFALAYFVYHRFGAPANEYDLKIYYNALTQWRSGGQLYDYSQYDAVNGYLYFTYPPAAAMLMSPMTVLSIPSAVALSSAAILAGTVALVLLAVRERVTLRRPQLAVLTAVATAGALCLQPISQTAAYGQVNIFLALLVMFDVFVLGKRGSRWAGIGIGLATAVKLTPAIFLLYLVLSGNWRMLRTALATAAGVTVLAALAAPAATWQYFTTLLWDSSRVGVIDNIANQSLNGTLARFADPLPPEKAAWLLASVLVVVLGSLRIRRAIAAGDTLLAVTVTGFIGVLISPVSWIHHAVWIAPAMILLVSRLIGSFPLRLFRLLAAAPAAYRTLADDDRRQLRGWLGIATLTITGLLAFVLNTRNALGLPDTDYTDLGVGSVLAASVQTLWMVAAVALLPIATAAARDRPGADLRAGQPARIRF
jgi:alpha-1,2-mannosyltransferase